MGSLRLLLASAALRSSVPCLGRSRGRRSRPAQKRHSAGAGAGAPARLGVTSHRPRQTAVRRAKRHVPVRQTSRTRAPDVTYPCAKRHVPADAPNASARAPGGSERGEGGGLAGARARARSPWRLSSDAMLPITPAPREWSSTAVARRHGDVRPESIRPAQRRGAAAPAAAPAPAAQRAARHATRLVRRRARCWRSGVPRTTENGGRRLFCVFGEPPSASRRAYACDGTFRPRAGWQYCTPGGVNPGYKFAEPALYRSISAGGDRRANRSSP